MTAPHFCPTDKEESSQGAGRICFLDFTGDDAAFLRALKNNEPHAKRALYERYAAHVQRVIACVLGPDDAIGDLIGDTFVEAYASIHRLQNPSKIKAWLSKIAMHVTRACIRRRTRRCIVKLFSPSELQDARIVHENNGDRETLRLVYGILDRFSADDRLLFSLRIIEGYSLAEIGEMLGVSRATLHRRFVRVTRRFHSAAVAQPALREWVEQGSRWSP